MSIKGIKMNPLDVFCILAKTQSPRLVISVRLFMLLSFTLQMKLIKLQVKTYHQVHKTARTNIRIYKKPSVVFFFFTNLYFTRLNVFEVI